MRIRWDAVCDVLNSLLVLSKHPRHIHICAYLLNCSVVSYSTVACQVPGPWNFPGKNTEHLAISSSRGSSWPRDQACVSCVCCIGRWILYHWATREALMFTLLLMEKPRSTSFLSSWDRNQLLISPWSVCMCWGWWRRTGLNLPSGLQGFVINQILECKVIRRNGSKFKYCKWEVNNWDSKTEMGLY